MTVPCPRSAARSNRPRRWPTTSSRSCRSVPGAEMTSGPVAVITGTRKGIGKHLAHHFAARGFRVVGCSREAPDWRASGYEHVQADVTDEAQVTALFAHVRRSLGRLDVLINNAGIASMNHLLLTPRAAVERLMRAKFLGAAGRG